MIKSVLFIVFLFLFIGFVGQHFLFQSTSSEKLSPVFVFSHPDIQWTPDLSTIAEEQRVSTPRKESALKLKNEKTHSQYPLLLSICQPDKRAPDYVAKQLRRATGHEDDPCARIKLNLNF